MMREGILRRVSPSIVATTLSLLIYLALLAAFVGSLVASWPAVTKVTNSYTLPYAPANMEVTHITNMFVQSVQLGGAGGIAAVQADETMVTDYVAKTSETEGKHYLSITPASAQTGVDYFYERPGSLILHHYGYAIPTPVYEKWLVIGNYETTSYNLKDGKLMLEGSFAPTDIGATLIFMIFAVGSVCYAALVTWIKYKVWWW